MHVKKIMDESINTRFAKSTSLHGVNHIVLEKSDTYARFWCFLVILSSLCCLACIIVRIVEYRKYPVSTDVNFKHASKVLFPAITFCIPFKYNKNSVSAADKQFFSIASKFLKMMMISFEELNSTKENVQKEIKKEVQKLGNFDNNLTRIFSASSFKIDRRTLKKCTFLKKTCTHEDFYFTLNLKGDSCWTFNGENNRQSVNYQLFPGIDDGLAITLDLRKDNYELPFITDEFGIQVFIHDPEEHPYFVLAGNVVGPGQLTRAALKYFKNRYLPKPYGNCKKKVNLDIFKKYSMFNCLTECILMKIANICQCKSNFGLANEDEFPECEIADLLGCYLYSLKLDIPETFDEMENLCECALGCRENVFDVTFTSLYLGASNQLKTLSAIYGDDAEYIRNNYILFNAFYQTLTFVETKERNDITLVSLFSDIGGYLALFLGMSILTIFEICQFSSQKLKSIKPTLKNLSLRKTAPTQAPEKYNTYTVRSLSQLNIDDFFRKNSMEQDKEGKQGDSISSNNDTSSNFYLK